MKTKLYKIPMFMLAVGLLGACDDKLDIDNPNRVSDQGYYATQNEAIAAVTAIYNPLMIDGFFQRIVPIYNDGRSDELICRSPWTFMTGFSNFTLPPTDPNGEISWAGHYIMINYANQALENVPSIPDLDPELLERLMGQAIFLRAFAHFQLANLYEVPPILSANPTSQEEFYPSNEGITQQDVYNFVEAELNRAIPMLPLNYDDVTGPDQGQTGRITRGAANALMGRLLLYQGRYQDALPYLAAVVTSGVYDLAPNYQDIFSGDPALEAADPGRIFWAEFTRSQNPTFNWGGDPSVNWRQFTALTPTYSVTDFYDFRPTQFLYDEMREELTIDGKLDPRYHATITSNDVAEGDTIAWGRPWVSGNGFAPNDFFVAKHTFANFGGGDAFTAGFNYPIIRFADVLLMYAEALANTGNIPQAAAQVQRVRDRANLPDREAEFAGYNLEEFMDQIAHERVVELALEGHRWSDIIRWGWLDDPNKLAELQSHDFEFNTYSPGRKVMPIPLTELDRNPNLRGSAAN
jgi:hypothetical protein